MVAPDGSPKDSQVQFAKQFQHRLPNRSSWVTFAATVGRVRSARGDAVPERYSYAHFINGVSLGHAPDRFVGRRPRVGWWHWPVPSALCP